MNTLTRWILCLPVVAGLTGCSIFQPTQSHLIEPDMAPALSQNAVASATGDLAPAPVFSLVAADSVGLYTFGYELALWDSLYSQPDTATALAD